MQWVGHRYLGPGNKLKSGTPIDRDDLLAALHDFAYEQGDIHESDKHFSEDFLLEYLNSGKVESFAGALGLSFKWLTEELFGQMYPWQMSSSTTKRPTHAGHRQYAARQQEISRLYREAKEQNPKLKWNSFLHAKGDLDKVPVEQLRPINSVSPGQKRGSESGAGPSIQRPRLSSAEESVRPESVNMDLSEADWEDVAVMDIGSDVADPLKSGQKSGGRDTSAGRHIESPYFKIPKSIQPKTYTLSFGKSRIFYTYGYAFQQITNKITTGGVDKGDKVYMTTPFCTLPVEALGFYMTPNEAGMLISRSSTKSIKCISATCKVVPQGLRTAFDTGSTLSGTATSEHCALGMSAIGLNHKVYLRSGKFDVKAEKPMIPTGVQDASIESIWKKYYGASYVENDTNIPMCLGVPRHVDLYASLLLNSTRDATNYVKHDEGWYQLDRYINRFLFTSQIGKPIIDWHYKSKNGYIGLKAHDIPYPAGDMDTMHLRPWLNNRISSVTCEIVKDGIPMAKEKEKDSEQEFVITNAWPTNILNYPIEPNTHISLHDGKPNDSMSVPSVHFGILPTPALNPALDSTDYQNTAAYFSVTCELVIEVNQSSLFPLTNNAHSTPDSVIFCMRNRIPTYNPNVLQPLAHACYE